MPTPDFFAFSEIAFKEFGAAEALPAIEERLGFPLVVKPAAQGSALGIKFAASAERRARGADRRVQLRRPRAARAPRRGPRAGRRPARGRRRACEALPIVEAKPKRGVLLRLRGPLRDRQDRLRLPRRPARRRRPTRAQELAVATYRLLGCYGFARVDMILAERRRAAGARGAGDPGPDRDEPAAAGRRGGRHLVRASWSSGWSSWRSTRVRQRPAVARSSSRLRASRSPRRSPRA